VPGTGVFVRTATGVFVRVAAGRLVGLLVAGGAVSVAIGVTGRSVGDGVRVSVGKGVFVGGGVLDGGTVLVIDGVIVGVG
jgi:hypothetical protein